MGHKSNGHWWERDDLRYIDGALHFAGHSVQELAQQWGTPTFFYAPARIIANLERLHSALNAAGIGDCTQILYAMKANRFPPLLVMLRQSELCGIDACSPLEVARAVSCGFDPAQISFTAGSLSEKDVLDLANYPGLFMDCDSLHAIRTWGALKPGSDIGIRINPDIGVSRSANDRLQYAGGATSKFGIYREQFDAALALAQQHDLRVTKIHFHTGCGYLTPQIPQWEQVIESCRWFLDRCDQLTCVNLGGGLGVPHTEDDGKLDLTAWASVLARQFLGRGLNIQIEPGEYLVKDAGLLLLGKTYLEQKKHTLFLGVDAGFNIAPEPAHYNMPFQPLALTDYGTGYEATTVVGNINEALDVWYADAQLPDMTNQAFVALINAGAYSASMASDHCMRGEFNEVLVSPVAGKA